MKLVKLVNIISVIFLLLSFHLYGTSVNAVDCLNDQAGGDLVLTTSCSFRGFVNGVDSGTDLTNSAVLTIGAGVELTINAGQTIAVGSWKRMEGSSIIMRRGGTMKAKTPIWMIDEDADGYPSTTTQYIQSTPPLNGKRRNTMTTVTTIDRDNQFYCPDSYNPNVTCKECRNGRLANQPSGTDRFSQCTGGRLCNGSGRCRLL